MDALSNPDKQEGRSHFTWLLAYKTYCARAVSMATARWKIYSCQNAAEAFIGKDSQYSYSLFRNEYSTLPQGTPQCCLRAVPVSQLDSVRKVFAAG